MKIEGRRMTVLIQSVAVPDEIAEPFTEALSAELDEHGARLSIGIEVPFERFVAWANGLPEGHPLLQFSTDVVSDSLKGIRPDGFLFEESAEP